MACRQERDDGSIHSADLRGGSALAFQDGATLQVAAPGRTGFLCDWTVHTIGPEAQKVSRLVLPRVPRAYRERGGVPNFSLQGTPPFHMQGRGALAGLKGEKGLDRGGGWYGPTLVEGWACC